MWQDVLVYVILTWAVFVFFRSVWNFFYKQETVLEGCSGKCGGNCPSKMK
jgi:hypothetical protein